MQSQHSTYSKPVIADFSSTLIQARAAEKKSARNNIKKPTIVQPFEEYDPYNNRNLSSVISSITDEGPANLDSKNDLKHSRNTRTGDSFEATNIPDDKYTPAIPANGNHQHVLPKSFSFEEIDMGNDEEQSSPKTFAVWHQLVLVLLIAVITVMGFLLYKLTLQTDELSDALRLNEEQLLRASDTQKLPSDVLPRLTSLGQSLTELKTELQGIKAGQQETNSRLDLNTPRDLEPRLMKITSTSEEVSELKNEFNRIQREMLKMETEIKVIKTEIPKNQGKITNLEMAPEQSQKQVQFRANQLVVTLASLTTREKALAAYEKLQRSGIAPLIEEIVVNDNKVYRINVDGFSSRAAASAFISEANEKFGFDGGWIRQN
jgi:predicted  nucleic acid-binding Zn-ribbon protein